MPDAADIMRALEEVKREQREIKATVVQLAPKAEKLWMTANEAMKEMGVGRTVFYSRIHKQIRSRWRGRYDPARVRRWIATMKGKSTK